jgi:hypothetical protein
MAITGNFRRVSPYFANLNRRAWNLIFLIWKLDHIPQMEMSTMICRSRAPLAALFGLLAAGPLMAHHSLGSEFQMGTPSAITGVLTRVEWDNPHIYWTVDVKDEGGKVTRWSVEGLPPSYLRRSGVTRQSMETLMGTTITVHGRFAKDGSKLMWAMDFTLPDGRVIPVGPRQGDPDAR